MTVEWEDRLAKWQDELDIFAQLDDVHWVPLAQAEAETGVSRSALRSSYRNAASPGQASGPGRPDRADRDPQARADFPVRLRRVGEQHRQQLPVPVWQLSERVPGGVAPLSVDQRRVELGIDLFADHHGVGRDL